MKNDFLIELLEKPPTYHSFWLALTLYENKPTSNITLYKKCNVSRSYGEKIFKWIIQALERHSIPFVLNKFSQKVFVISFSASAQKTTPKIPKTQVSFDFGQNIKEDTKVGAKIDRLIRYLNSLSGKDYSINVKSHRFLLNELCYKYSEDEIRMVIAYKCNEWISTPQEKWLRPSTLFGAKFDEYRVEASASERKEDKKDSNENGTEQTSKKHDTTTNKASREFATGLDAARTVFGKPKDQSGETDVPGSLQEPENS